MGGVQNLRVRLLGDLQVEGCDPARLGRRQVRTLLKILALRHDRPVSTDTVIECLWGDRPPVHPTDQVSVLASRLRGALGAERVRHGDGGYTLLLDWLDLDALRNYTEESERRLAQGAVGAARTAAAAGLSLIRGPLLADEADPWWASTDRSVAELLTQRLEHATVAAALAAGDWNGVVQASNAFLAVDPNDEVVLRSLMEALARSGRVASALATYAATRERVGEELGVGLSSETEELHTAILRGELPESPRTQEPRTPPTELPGRAEPLRRLNEILEGVGTGRADVVLIEGEGGMGKSRLSEAWGEHLTGQGHKVVRIPCDELGQGLPLQPLLDVVSELISVAVGESADAVLGPDAAVLGPFLGTHPEPTGAAQLAALTDPGAGQALLFGAINNVLRRQCTNQTMVLLLDDLHLSDPATIRWLAQTPRRFSGLPLLVVGTCRSEEGFTLPGAITITLEPLDLSAAALIVGADRAAELHERSGGNPLFLVELAASDAGDELPETIRVAVADRCNRTGPAALTLRTAAVVGRDVDLDLLAAVTSTPPAELLDHLEIGLGRQFLVEKGPQFAFAHELVREALAASVGAARTAFIHREVARSLEARGDPDSLAVARHARLGGELAHASAMLVVGARVAVSRFDQDEAMRLLNEAITLSDSAVARVERARVLSMMAHYEDASADIEAARSLGAGPEILEVAAWSAHFERRFDAALVLADRGAEEATSDDLRTSCRSLGGWVSLVSGDLTGAESRLESAIGAAPETSGRMAESWLAWLRMNQGRPEESLRLARHADGKGLAAYRFPNAYALMAATMSLAMLGRADDALTTLDELDVEVARMGAQRWTPRSLNLRGWIARSLGEFTLGDELNRAAIDAAGGQGMAEPRANALLDLVSGRLLAGDLGAAEDLLAEADPLSDVEHAFRWRHQLRGRLLRARLDLATGQCDSANAGAAALADEAATLGAPRYEVQAKLVELMAQHRQGVDTDLEAVEHLVHLLDKVAGLESWWITAELANEFGVNAWRDLARARASALATRSGHYRPAFERAVARRLD
jgi:DNA-binding SARP family transcriptional activator